MPAAKGDEVVGMFEALVCMNSFSMSEECLRAQKKKKLSLHFPIFCVLRKKFEEMSLFEF